MNNLGKDNINTESPYCLGQYIELYSFDDIEIEPIDIDFDIDNFEWLEVEPIEVKPIDIQKFERSP